MCKVLLCRFLEQLDILLLNQSIKRKFYHFLCLAIYILKGIQGTAAIYVLESIRGRVSHDNAHQSQTNTTAFQCNILNNTCVAGLWISITLDYDDNRFMNKFTTIKCIIRFCNCKMIGFSLIVTLSSLIKKHEKNFGVTGCFTEVQVYLKVFP